MESGSSVAYGGLPAKGAIVNERNVVKKSEKDGNKSQDGHCCVAIRSLLVLHYSHALKFGIT